MTTTVIDTHEEFDAEGNLIHSYQTERIVPDNAMIEVVEGLTSDQRQALLAALAQVGI